MRILIMLFLSLLTGCNSKMDASIILGAWTIEQDESKYPKAGFTDIATFFPNDSLKVEIYNGSQLNQFFYGTYKVNKKRKTITTRLDKLEVEFEIVSISEKKLVLKDIKRKIITNYKRL